MSFLNSIEKKSKKFESPFTHWELNEPLTERQVNEIVNADIANPTEYNLNYDGTRAIDGGMICPSVPVAAISPVAFEG